MKTLFGIFIFAGIFCLVRAGKIRIKRSSECYQRLGCFSNSPPFNNADGALPLSPDFIRTTFYLFTNENKPHPDILSDGDVSVLRHSHYNGTRKTVFIVHGFLQNGMVDWTVTLAQEILKKEQANVIIVDWGHGSGFPYTQAVANTRVVGAEIASLINFLISETSAQLSRFHLIGHSLGSHICGYAGERLDALGRITGLDPAQPNFKGYDIRVRLDPSDANFVDVIHTDGSQFETYAGYGMSEPVGHMDFYPNGGYDQPGCPHESWMTIMEEGYQEGAERTADLIACSHSRSIELLTESINSPCSFKSFPCANAHDFMMGRCFDCGDKPCPAMGYNANQYTARGKFYLATTAHSPYCGHQYLVDFKFGDQMPQAYGQIKVSILGSHGLSDHVYIDGRHNGFRPNQEQHVMVVTHGDLGRILQVQVSFEAERSMFWWGSGSHIRIHHILVQPGRMDKPWFFCGRNRRLDSGERTGFHTPSRDHRSCHPNSTIP